MRLHALVVLAFLPACVLAQSRVEREGTLDPRKNQKIEHIVVEDRGNRIEELRVGGETQKVTVQPKNSRMPAYEIPRSDMAHSQPADGRDSSGGRKQRVWNVLGF